LLKGRTQYHITVTDLVEDRIQTQFACAECMLCTGTHGNHRKVCNLKRRPPSSLAEL